MKNLKIYLIFCIVFVSVACNNENDSTNFYTENPVHYDEILDGIPLVKNPCDIELYLNIFEDKDDEKIVRGLYEISVQAFEIFSKGDINPIVLKSAEQNANKTFDLRTLKDQSTMKSSSVEFVKLVEMVDNIDLTRNSKKTLKSTETEIYVPAIFVPNADIADYNKRPLICPGVAVNSELDGAEEYEEYIVAWYLDENGEKQEIIINEETAMSTTNPVMIFDNASAILCETYDLNINCIKQNTNKSTQSLGKNFWATKEYQINERHEFIGNSEFWITAFHTNENGDGWYTWTDYNVWYGEAQIAFVAYNDIGTQLEAWFNFCNVDVEPYNDNYVFYNTYERDWYCSEKPLGTTSEHNGVRMYFTGNMQYTSDWYAYDPDDIDDSRLDFAYIYANWAKWYQNDRTKLRFWRCEF